VLYSPQKAYRLYYPDQVDARPPVGANPPAGALIDYYLGSKPQGDVTLDILDADGKEVRHLSSHKANKEEQPPEWPDQVFAMDTLPAERGMNRFVWNMRYDDPAEIPDAFYEGEAPRGPIAMSGHYTLKLTVAGKTMTAPLDIALDPRSRGSEAGLKAKFDLAMEVYRDQDALHRAVNEIRDAKSDVAALHKRLDGKPGSAMLLAEGDSVVSDATPIEEKLMQVNIKGSEANLNFPGMLNEQIYAFAGLLDDADSAPNKQELDTYYGFHAQLAAQVDAWAKLKDGPLAAFRAHAKQAASG